MSTATDITRAANLAFSEQMPPEDGQDFADARAGFIGTWDEPVIKDPEGRVVWNFAQYDFLEAEQAPDTVNPSLWRQARLNRIHGLFKVCERIYQVRGFDIANLSIIEGDTGLILIDPLTTVDVARAALALYLRHRPARPIVAVIYTHSHVDHYGGVKGVISQAQVDAGQVQVIAPSGFLQEAVSENLIAGPAMQRRALYQFGPLIPAGVEGQVDAGLGKVTARGVVSLIAPTVEIREEVETHRIDGVEIVFQLTPETEAPAEMHLFFPQMRALNTAENVTHLMHNLLPIRGAQARNALAWSKSIDHALRHYAPHADLVFAQHHWPKFGQARITGLLAKQRDLYRFMHDQAVRLMNKGLTAVEIAETIRLPHSLSNEFHLRGYYGALVHNVKAVYQRYLGWYDANPANLNALPPADYAAKLVEYMGGAEAALQRARADFDKGQYRWVAQIANHLVFADPSNQAARDLCIAAFEQMAFQAEASTWRNAYLQGAIEMRQGAPRQAMRAAGGGDSVKALRSDMIFDMLAIRVLPEKAEGRHLVINWHFSDSGDKVASNLENCVLSYRLDCERADAQTQVRMPRAALVAVMTRQASLDELVTKGVLVIEGRREALGELFGMLDEFGVMFNIVEP